MEKPETVGQHLARQCLLHEIDQLLRKRMSHEDRILILFWISDLTSRARRSERQRIQRKRRKG